MLRSRSKDPIFDKGNPQFFEGLFRQYSKPLFYYATKFVDSETARDIVQDVFVKLWSDHSISINQSLNALLFTMIRNTCLQHLEKQKVRNKYSESAGLLLREDELRYYTEERTSLIEQELEDKLNEVLNNLPERCSEIFKMSRFENKKNREIAEELDISVKAVEKQITKALATIRIEMKDYLPLLIFVTSSLFKK
ncbi:MAG: RNA polymerase sigma-70 factor [Mariniphaga sp.]